MNKIGILALWAALCCSVAQAQPVTTKVPLTNMETSCTAANFIAGNGSGISPQCGTVTTTGSSGPATLSGGVLNIPQYTGGGGGSGTVTSVSVTSANGFAGTVATATTTPAITLSTSVTGILKGNGTGVSAATAGTDYQSPITLTTIGTGAATFVSNTLNIPTPSGTGTVTSITCFGTAITISGTCTTTGQLPGETSNGSASSGNIGEYTVLTVASGSAVAATSTVPFNIGSFSLTAGDWDCRAVTQFTAASGATVSVRSGWLSSTSASVPTGSTSYFLELGTTLAANAVGAAPTGIQRFSLSGSTTIYLSAQYNFASGSVVAYGTAACRRAR